MSNAATAKAAKVQQRAVVVSGGGNGVVSLLTLGDPDYVSPPKSGNLRKDALPFLLDAGWTVVSATGSGEATAYGANWLLILEKQVSP